MLTLCLRDIKQGYPVNNLIRQEEGKVGRLILLMDRATTLKFLKPLYLKEDQPENQRSSIRNHIRMDSIVQNPLWTGMLLEVNTSVTNP